MAVDINTILLSSTLLFLIMILWKLFQKEQTPETDENKEKEDFRLLASDVLRGLQQENNEAFLTLANERLGQKQSEVNKDMESKKEAIDDMLKPLSKNLEKITQMNQEIEKARVGAYEGIKQHLSSLEQNTMMLGQRADQLSTALTSSSNVRGNWGEIALKRLLEMAGLTEHADFFEQESVGGGRPDVIVRLPNEGAIPIDAKASAKHYLEALEIEPGQAQDDLLSKHAEALKEIVKRLGSKAYQDKLEGDIDYVVMFVPSEALISAAFNIDPTLHEFALEKSVLIASPVSLLALLRNAALYWQQQTLADGAKEIYDVSREMYSRTVTFFEHVEKIGEGLANAEKYYDKAKTSYQSRILPQGKKLEKLQVSETLRKKLPELDK
ncbi:MAG: hypothetical protein CMB64_06395 [Euryarchaeota archaeon]|nr:hypothetical protein [Euryarchaeota archaeon]